MSRVRDPQPTGSSRRQFLTTAAAAVAAPVAATASSARADAATPRRQPGRSAAQPPRHNILYVFTDQERYFGRWPKGLSLPGHERLAERGVTFHRHYCPAVMCTSSRAVMLTGLQTADNRMFENADLPYVGALSKDVPTIGHMLRKAGYYTAYKGKWHLDAAFDHEESDRLFRKEMEAYGFSDYNWPGDVLAHTLGGYTFDHLIAGSAQSWLRRNGRPLADQGKPWALFVSLVNPHDIMYFNTDAPGEQVQDTGRLMMHAARAPEHESFRATWDMALPSSLSQPVDAPGRPGAHAEFDRAWGYTLGRVPLDPARWKRFSDYYLNCIRSVDLQVSRLLTELDELGLTDSTIVMFTSDHGEMGGAHGLRGKGPFAYEEAIHLPFHVVHPDVRGGQDCRALTSHIDVVPTLLSMAGLPPGKSADAAGRDLPGKDLGPLFTRPGTAPPQAAREGVLFTYSGLAMNDSNVTRFIADAKVAGRNPKDEIKASGYKPDFKKRGTLRTVFDGRHKLTRYCSPLERNRPRTVDDVYARNDVELFDLEADPGEMTNLAADRTRNGELVDAMSAKLERLIAAEIGVDDGREMPQVDGISWAIERIDL